MCSCRPPVRIDERECMMLSGDEGCKREVLLCRSTCVKTHRLLSASLFVHVAKQDIAGCVQKNYTWECNANEILCLVLSRHICEHWVDHSSCDMVSSTPRKINIVGSRHHHHQPAPIIEELLSTCIEDVGIVLAIREDTLFLYCRV